MTQYEDLNKEQTKAMIGVLKILMSISIVVTAFLIAWSAQNSNDILSGLAIFVAVFIGVVAYRLFDTILIFIEKLGQV